MKTVTIRAAGIGGPIFIQGVRKMPNFPRYKMTEFVTDERKVVFNTDVIAGIITIHEDLEGEISVVTLTVGEVLAVAVQLWEKQRVSEKFDLPFSDPA